MAQRAKDGAGAKKGRKDKAATGKVVAGVCVAGHPRSAAMVRRAKGWGGVGGLALATYLALRAGVPPLDAMVRGLAGGLLGYVALWAISVTAARQLVVAEVRARHAQLISAAADEGS